MKERDLPWYYKLISFSYSFLFHFSHDSNHFEHDNNDNHLHYTTDENVIVSPSNNNEKTSPNDTESLNNIMIESTVKQQTISSH